MQPTHQPELPGMLGLQGLQHWQRPVTHLSRVGPAEQLAEQLLAVDGVSLLFLLLLIALQVLRFAPRLLPRVAAAGPGT